MVENFVTNRRLPLVGRNRELEIVQNQYEACRTARLKVVMLAGEPGIGKSRLLAEIAVRLREAGATVLRGGASQAEGMPPYLPFLEALGKYIETASPDDLRAQTAQLATTLISILPELAARLETLPQTYPLPPEQARFRLFKAVGDFLRNIALTAPLVLLLDDLQWADAASLDLLGHIARHQADTSILVVGAYREAELKDNPALQQTVFQLNRLRVLVTLPLKSLTEVDLTSLAAQFLKQNLAADLGRQLYSQSEGNPFFAEELLRQWLEEGWLTLTGDRWNFAEAAQARSSLPGSIANLIDQHLSRLNDKVTTTLQVAAIIGRSFELTFLANVVGEEPEAVEERLLAAERAGLIRQVGLNTYLFGHDKIREGIYAQVSPFRRKRLHGFIGRELEQQGGEKNARACENLAYHFLRSGDGQRGAHYAMLAGERALAAFAPAEALSHYRAALELLEAGDPRRGDWLLKQGEVERLNGKDHDSLATFRQALAFYQETGDRLGEGRAYYELGRAYWRFEELKPAQLALQQALSLLESLPEKSALLVSVLVELGSLVAVSLNRQSDGLTYGYRALELARRLNEPRLEAAACRVVGNLLARTNKIRQGLPLLETGLALAQRENDLVEASESCACLSLGYYWTGQLKRYIEVMALRAELAERSQDTFQLRHVYVWQALGEIMQGRIDRAEQLLNKTMPVVEKLESPEPKAFLMQAYAHIKFHRGEYDAALREMAGAMAIFRETVPESLVWYLSMLTYMQHCAGDQAGALVTLAEEENMIWAQQPTELVVADALSKLVPVVLDLRNREKVARYHAGLLPFTGLFVDVLVDRLLAEMEIFLGDLAAAQTHLEAAEAVARDQGYILEIGFCKAARAKLLQSQGRSSEARLSLEEAITLFKQTETKSEEDYLQHALTRLKEGTSSPRIAHPAGLSEREVAVLRLVAAGYSNRQIARELALSEKTVANHLTGIFNKTNSDNRAAATAFALRHGIAR